ncbi:hypothetical protein [Nocardia sp. NPDC005366]|uniref:hypothetical protein n=1 Tax=Nocardia sp. NPDC005366 TaxID=3156878 RepID=UPI0033AFEBDD
MTVEAIAVVPEDSLDGGISRFLDERSGCTFFVAAPAACPALWDEYLRGAQEVYRHFGVESALEYEQIRDGMSTALFFLGIDPSGTAVAGVRMQGSYTDVDQVRGVSDWAGHRGAEDLRRMVADRIPAGVIEAKGAWVARDAPHRSALSDVVSRTVLHGARLLDARFGFATVATFTVQRHRASGAVVAEHIPSVPYPDARYETVPIWWDTHTYPAVADRSQSARTRAEMRELAVTRPRPDGRRLASAWHGSKGPVGHGR